MSRTIPGLGFLLVCLVAGAAWAAGGEDLAAYKEEPVSGWNLLVTAYVVMWLLVAGFVGRLLRQQAKTTAQVQELHEQVIATMDAAAEGPAGGVTAADGPLSATVSGATHDNVATASSAVSEPEA